MAISDRRMEPLVRKIVYLEVRTVEAGYKDIGLCDTSTTASDILWYQLIPRHNVITLGSTNTRL